jgi:hypothetical protein
MAEDMKKAFAEVCQADDAERAAQRRANSKSELREKISDVQHKIWNHWMKYQFSVCVQNEDGSLTIPATKVERWKGQMATSYFDLPENSKDSDREQTDKVLAILKAATPEELTALLSGS